MRVPGRAASLGTTAALLLGAGGAAVGSAVTAPSTKGHWVAYAPSAPAGAPLRHYFENVTPVTPPTPTTTTPPAPTEGIEQVDFLDATHGNGLFFEQNASGCSYAVGSTADGGQTFSPRVVISSAALPADPASTCTPPAVDALTFDGTGDGFAYGPSLFVTHDGGRTWSAQPSGPVLAISAIGRSVWMLQASCPSGQDFDGANQCNLALQKSDDGGRSWTPLASPFDGSQVFEALAMSEDGSLNTTWFLRTTTASAFVVVPWSQSGNPVTAVYGTTDGGHSWRSLASPYPVPGFKALLSAAPDGTLWFMWAGQPSAGGQLKTVVRSTDGGRSWHGMCTPATPSTTYPSCLEGDGMSGGYLSDFVATSSTTAFLSGGRNFLRVTHDGGATWALTNPVVGNGDDVVSGLRFINPEDGWVIVGEPNSATLWHTTDGGVTWSQGWPIAGVRFPRCSTSQLDVNVAHLGVGAGMVAAYIDFLNKGAQPCSLYGFPGVAGVDAAGQQVMQAVRQGGPPAEVVLAQAQLASAMVGTNDNPVGSNPCIDVTALWVTPPGDTESVAVPLGSGGPPVYLHACTPLTAGPVVQGQGFG